MPFGEGIKKWKMEKKYMRFCYVTIILNFLDKKERKLHISSFTSFFLGFLGSGISEVVFLISLLFVCIAQKVSFKVFASMSEGRRERATQ